MTISRLDRDEAAFQLAPDMRADDFGGEAIRREAGLKFAADGDETPIAGLTEERSVIRNRMRGEPKPMINIRGNPEDSFHFDAHAHAAGHILEAAALAQQRDFAFKCACRAVEPASRRVSAGQNSGLKI